MKLGTGRLACHASPRQALPPSNKCPLFGPDTVDDAYTLAEAAKEVQIHLPAETWTEVLPSCGRESLAERVSLIRRQFHAIARPLIDGPRRRILPRMAFLRSRAGNNLVLVKLVQNNDDSRRLVELPVADVPPPPSVMGFSLIELNNFDTRVLSFLCSIRHLFDDVCLEIKTCRSSKWDSADSQNLYITDYGEVDPNLAALECLFRVLPRLVITRLSIRLGLRVINGGLLARLLANVRQLLIKCKLAKPELLSLETDGWLSHCSPHIPVLIEWLHTPVGNGQQQKVANFIIGNIVNLMAFVTQARERFLSATANATVPYFVAFYSVWFNGAQRVQLPFTRIRNEHSGEVLSLRYYSEPLEFERSKYNFVLFRRRISAHLPTPILSDELAEQLQIKQTFERTNSPKKWPNKLVLNIAQMSEIDESLFPADPQDESPLVDAEQPNDESAGPSNRI